MFQDVIIDVEERCTTNFLLLIAMLQLTFDLWDLAAWLANTVLREIIIMYNMNIRVLL